jgi:hypothetical protein
LDLIIGIGVVSRSKKLESFYVAQSDDPKHSVIAVISGRSSTSPRTSSHPRICIQIGIY